MNERIMKFKSFNDVISLVLTQYELLQFAPEDFNLLLFCKQCK